MENGTTEYFLKIITPFHVLCKVAEVYDLQLPLKVKKILILRALRP